MQNLNQQFKRIGKQCISLASNRDSFANTGIFTVCIIIIGMWLAGVIFTAAHHEFWRDEVRSLSLARAAGSPFQLFDLIQYDGHPIIWYLLLYLGTSISDTSYILPILSIVISLAAVTVFTLYSPFPLWLKTLFLFSVLPFYEYSVMARNYGISMLFFFLFAALYKKRSEYPLLLALVLFLLANTNVHSAILVWPLILVWYWDIVFKKNTLPAKNSGISMYAPLVIVLLGFMLCLITTWPRSNTILNDIHSITLINVAKSFAESMLFPAEQFSQIVGFSGLIGQIIVWLAMIGLILHSDLFLAAITGHAVLSVFFQLAYHGTLRHQGLFLVFLITLYWIALENTRFGDIKRLRKILFNAGLYVSLIVMIFTGLSEAKHKVKRDIRWELSSNQALGEFISGSPMYRNAIIVPEPGTYVEALPYYVNNEIYLPREQRFGKTVSWTTDAKANLSLGELLATGYKVRKTYGRPVLIVLGHFNLDKGEANEKKFSYNKIFSWNDKDLSELNLKTKLVMTFKSARGDENYAVYAID